MIAVFGWLGTLLYLLNHAYISLESDWKTRIYYSGNLLAAVLLVMQSSVLATWQAVAINAFWALVSVALLCRLAIDKVPFSMRGFLLLALLLIVWVGSQATVSTTALLSALGWSSAYFFCASYLLFSSGKMPPRYYFLCNLYAALALLPQLWISENWPVFCLEIIWAVLSAIGAAKRFYTIHLID